MGRDGREPEADGHLRITHCQGTLLGLGSRSKGFAKCRLVATNVAFSYFFFLFTPEKRHYRPNSLSASTPPTSTCVEFFHNLVLIAVTDSGLYLATIVTSSSNADTRLLSLYLKTLKNAHKDD